LHPISSGPPETFIANDEIYHQLRLQPGIQVLATAWDDPQLGGTGRHEPMLWTVSYGKGRVFHTALGHDVTAMAEPGFISSFTRGVLWAALGKVDLPAAAESLERKPVRAMVVTGGHPHDASFYSLFDDAAPVQAEINPHPVAFSRDLRASCDVLVLYDLVQRLEEVQKRHLRDFVESGKGVVLLHHSIADYNDWTWWWRDVVGGRYLLEPADGLPRSLYKHDVEQNVAIAAEHPVTRGLPPMHLFDETYKSMWISPEAKVLLRSDAATSDGPVAWISPYPKSRVVYIQLGHDHQAHLYPPYRRLVRNAVLWAAGEKE
jgi:type 1 glutamine amidotransferase